MRPLSRAVAVAFLAVALLVTSSPAPVHAAGSVVAERAKPKGPGGTYTGAETPTEPNPLDRLEIGFEVSKNGRKIKKWLVTMNVICGLDVRLIAQSMPTMKVKRNGRFHSVYAGTLDGTDYRVEVGGKLVAKKRKVKQGTLSYEVGWCQRGNDAGNPLRWKAKRTGR
ncbi:hypothetical protein [Nocardioides humi]|uniref:Uncharacterized protein n=1 Tax=Nocardioides humi TaxID=449461 RepID=A0ABN2BBU3_9ACTN|nr:hypothetical protein [Nocardioides humi]